MDAQGKILDEILLPLGDQFEAGIPSRWQPIEPASAEEYEPLRQCLAGLLAEGSIIQPAGSSAKVYQLTTKGYLTYKS
jgi:hypothetical protein